MTTNKLFFSIAAIVMAALVLSACAPTQQQPTPTPGQQTQGVTLPTVNPVTGTYASFSSLDPQAKLASIAFKDEAELTAFAGKVSGSGYYGSYYRGGVMVDYALSESAGAKGQTIAMPVAAPTGDGDTGDYSSTNNQVQGVDEGDILKTDGNYIYTVSGTTLYIIEATPAAEAKILSTLSFKKGSPQGLFIQGERLAVFGTLNDYEDYLDKSFKPRDGLTFFEIYDVSDRAKPTLVKSYTFTGTYQTSRLKEGTAYLVVQSSPYREIPGPLVFEDGIKRMVPVDSIRYFPIPYQNPIFVTAHAIDLASMEDESATLTVEYTQAVYMSEDNLYLAYTDYIDEWQLRQDVTMDLVLPKLSETDLKLIAKIKATDDEVLSQAEKEQKIYQVVNDYLAYLPSEEQEELNDRIEEDFKELLESYDYFEYTVINRINVENGEVTVAANGKVPGHVVNQFSMDEKDGVLRIATTVSARWSSYSKENQNTQAENMVFTLDSDLDVIDSLKRLALDETIYSTRFMGDRLYMVTFKQVDPFFVIDLSDEKDIKLLGDLKIPGYSTYLHPYDENTVIGLGRDATEAGRVKGLKISLYDVSDVSKPKEIASFTTDERYASSTAEYEHKAFLFSKEKELLVIPAYANDYTSRDAEYNGALVFRITAEEITLRGLIDHAKGAQYDWGPAVERSLYIGDNLYTKSYGLLRINSLDTLTGVKDIELLAPKTSSMPVY